jgi:hypothetical protein
VYVITVFLQAELQKEILEIIYKPDVKLFLETIISHQLFVVHPKTEFYQVHRIL